MAKLYYFYIENKCSVFIAANSWKQARNIAYKTCPFQYFLINLTDIKGFLIPNIFVDKLGVLENDYIIKNLFVWWTCGNSKCGNNHNFIAINNSKHYRCPECGYEGIIPVYNKKEN